MIAIDVGLLRRTVDMHGPYLKAYINHHVQQMLLHFVHVTYLHLLLRFNVALGCYGEMFSDTWTKSCFVHMLTHGCESRFFLSRIVLTRQSKIENGTVWWFRSGFVMKRAPYKLKSLILLLCKGTCSSIRDDSVN